MHGAHVLLWIYGRLYLITTFDVSSLVQLLLTMPLLCEPNTYSSHYHRRHHHCVYVASQRQSKVQHQLQKRSSKMSIRYISMKNYSNFPLLKESIIYLWRNILFLHKEQNGEKITDEVNSNANI